MTETTGGFLSEEQIAAIRERSYENMCKKPSDINEHLPTLRRLATECSHVTEMGMRTGLSTLAFLAAEPKTLVSWDIDPMSILSANTVNLLAMASSKTSFQPRVGDSREILIEPTDLLFIDTLHTSEQLKVELFRHVMKDYFTGSKVRRYLVFHDTSTFGFVGEDGKAPGLLGALKWFQDSCFPVWALVEQHLNNNGLTVLKRI